MDQYSLSVECFNHDLLESDELVGTAKCSLLPAFKRGRHSNQPFFFSTVAVASNNHKQGFNKPRPDRMPYAVCVPFPLPIENTLQTL